jgi:hypothetical protein
MGAGGGGRWTGSSRSRNASKWHRWIDLHQLTRFIENDETLHCRSAIRGYGSDGWINSWWLHNQCSWCIFYALNGNNSLSWVCRSSLPATVYGYDEISWSWLKLRWLVPLSSRFRTLAFRHRCWDLKITRDAEPKSSRYCSGPSAVC